MNVVWIAIGIVSLCMPHVSAAPFGGSNAWSGLPYPAEALIVCLALLAVARVEVVPKTRDQLPQAALWAAVAVIGFECVCAVGLPQYCGNLILSFVGEMVHAVAVSLWLMATALDDSEPKSTGSLPVVVRALLCVSGVAWYVATAWVRSGFGLWDPTLESAQWMAALLWALPLVCLLGACGLEARSFALCAACPFVGVLLGNRGWLFAVQVAKTAPGGIAWQVLFVAPALSLAAFLCAVVLGAGEEPAEEAETEDSSDIPLHLVPGSEKLSAREREVVLLSLAGLSAAEVAERCGVALSTARTYLSRAFDKMGVVGTAEIAAAMKDAVGDNRGQSFSVPQESTAGTYLMSQLFATGTLVGLTLGLLATALLFGAQVPLALRIVLTALPGAAAVWNLLRAQRLDAGVLSVTVAAGVLVVVCLVPQGIRAQLLLHGWGAYPVALGMVVVAFVLVNRAVSDRLVAVASVALAGDERILAYLEGRGLKDYVAQVALLTARGYPQGGIAKTLSLSRSTVTHYRHRAYETLGVANKAELIRLLEDEAGLS